MRVESTFISAESHTLVLAVAVTCFRCSKSDDNAANGEFNCKTYVPLIRVACPSSTGMIQAPLLPLW